jgi:hypothetical protein
MNVHENARPTAIPEVLKRYLFDTNQPMARSPEQPRGNSV